MFSFFKKVADHDSNEEKHEFNFELVGCALAYEVAKADGDIDENELMALQGEINKQAQKLGLDEDDVMSTIERQSNELVSFNDFINQINEYFTKDQKIQMIKFLWQTAYADNVLDVDEERLIRRIADMIRIKDMEVLKLKDVVKNTN